MRKLNELQVAESIMSKVLTFAQYGAKEGEDAKLAENNIYKEIEHFLRRDEVESAYYDYFNPMPESATQAAKEMRAAEKAVDEILNELDCDV